MTNSSTEVRPERQAAGWPRRRGPLLLALLSLAAIPALYLATLARSLVLGDPTEYTFVANILGIAHPPGYAFITLAGKLFQTLIPVGTIPWRMHLLSATAATLAALFVFGTVRAIAGKADRPIPPGYALAAALFAALTVATGANQWQHAIHTNPHIITAAFLAANIYCLSRWWAGGSDRWLFAFSFSAGLGVTHHPLTVFAFPAYALFILAVRPHLWRQGRTWLKMVAFALLGLSLWLYFPLRSPMKPLFGPDDMNSLDGFLNVVLARGLRVNLFHFGLADQGDRALVFATLLHLQYSLPTLGLALLGLGWLGSWPEGRKGLLLYGLAFLGNTLFVINTVQDVMAYLLGPFLLVGLFAGIGLLGLLHLLGRRLARHGPPGLLRQEGRPLLLLLAFFALLGPGQQTLRNLPRISLRSYREGEAYVEAVFERFAGTGEGAVLLQDWEHMTPMWYSQFVEGRWPDPADVTPLFVSTARPWLASVFDTLPGGPVYLSGYRREIVEAGFRLRPDGPFYQVVEPGDPSLPPGLTPFAPEEQAVQRVGYALPQPEVAAGSYVPLVLALRAPAGTEDFYVPVAGVGDLRFPFTTDSHVTSPSWLPGEVIVERFDFALPPETPAGEYPVTVQMLNLSRNRLEGEAWSLGRLRVRGATFPVTRAGLLASFRQRVGLVKATARDRGRAVQAPWPEPLPARPGDVVRLRLTWRSLAPAEESYTVFVHLIDAGNQPLVALDYTPLGGATPTYLWIPKWLPGQEMVDPYRLQIPPELPAGDYFIEVGLYEMTSGRRLHLADDAGNLAGDRYILGGVRVEP